MEFPWFLYKLWVWADAWLPRYDHRAAVSGDFKPKLHFSFRALNSSIMWRMQMVNLRVAKEALSRMFLPGVLFLGWIDTLCFICIFDCLEENLHIWISFAIAIGDIFPGDFEWIVLRKRVRFSRSLRMASHSYHHQKSVFHSLIYPYFLRLGTDREKWEEITYLVTSNMLFQEEIQEKFLHWSSG